MEELKLPQLAIVDDYHELSAMQYAINLVTVRKTKVKEIGFDGDSYIGIIYQGARPDKIEIERLLRYKGMTLEDLE